MVSAAANGGSLCLFWSLSSLGDFDGVRFHGGDSCCVGGGRGRLSCNVVSPIWTMVTVYADEADDVDGYWDGAGEQNILWIW